MEDLFSNLDEFSDDVGIEPEDAKHSKGNQQQWFKGEKGVTYRGALVYFHPLDVAIASAAVRKAKKDGTEVNKEQVLEVIKAAYAKRAEELKKDADQLAPYEKLDLSKVRFKKTLAHYKDGMGYVVSRLGKDGREADEAWKQMGEQKTYFSTALLLYPTNREGEVLKNQLAQGWDVKPWRCGGKIHDRLIKIGEGLRSNDLNITGQDLTLKCTNTDYQNFDIDPAGKALWRMNPALQAKVLEAAYDLYDKLVPFRELSSADLRIKLGLSGGGSTDDISTDDDIMNMLENI